ncbi:MAG TPA: hypothetical protein VH475_06375 [Tepidisphaeraceae bacterium]
MSAQTRLVVVLVLLALARAADGGISAPNSSVINSRDGTRMLVMLSPEPSSDQTSTAKLPDGRVVNIHDVFAKSGVYETATFAPVWQVDWFALGHDVLCSDDLRYVARRNRWGFHAGRAIAFYDRGKLVRTYDCATLLTGMKGAWCLPFSTWDWHTRWYEGFDLDADHKAVLLSTARRRTYVMGHVIDLGRQEFDRFDLASGSAVGQWTAGAWVVWAYGVGLVLLLVSCVVVMVLSVRWCWRRMKVSDRRRGFSVAVHAGD